MSARDDPTTETREAQLSEREAAGVEAETEGHAVAAPATSLELSPTTSLKSDTSDAMQRREQVRRESWRENNPSSALPKRADTIALTVSGGVSLGSYEAGMLHFLTESLRRSPGSAKLRIVTGASAGSANAMIAATDACQTKIAAPEHALGYQTWVKTGLDKLFDPKRVTSRSLFVRDGLQEGFTKIAHVWQEGLPADCDFVIGVAVTREQGYDVHLAPGLVVPRQAERFVVRVQGRGPNAAPIFDNYLDPMQNFERPLLPLTGGRDKRATADVAAMRQLTSASAAFPIAFDSQPIEHCTTGRRHARTRKLANNAPRCDVATRVDSFVDGGVFDNNPLGTAYQVATEGLLNTSAGTVFREVPTGGPEKLPEVVYGYLDPDLRNYSVHEPPQKGPDEPQDPLVSILTRLGGQVLRSARGHELAALAERDPRALQRLWLLEASYPPISEMLGAFLGFFEEDFRDFDFHLGSYDNLRDLRDQSGSILGVEPFLGQLDRIMRGPIEKVPGRYRKLACIMAHAEPDRHARLAPLCSRKGLKNFRILLQVTIDRLWSNCRLLDEKEASDRSHLQCKRARGGLAPPVVDTTFRVRKQRFRKSEESEFDYAMRLLSDYGFHFKDLELGKDESHLGRLAVRRKLDQMVAALSNAQPGFTDRTMVLTAGRILVNKIQYEPPVTRWYVMLGSSIAVGYLHRISHTLPFFWNADIREHNLRSLVTDRPNEFSSTLSFGAEWAVTPLSGTVLQSAIALRGGYKMSVKDSIGFAPCEEVQAQADSRFCSQPVIVVPFSLTFLERLRFTVSPLIYPMKQSWGHKIFDLELGFGGEFF